VTQIKKILQKLVVTHMVEKITGFYETENYRVYNFQSFDSVTGLPGSSRSYPHTQFSQIHFNIILYLRCPGAGIDQSVYCLARD
jgi:hypothetical protein